MTTIFKNAAEKLDQVCTAMKIVAQEREWVGGDLAPCEAVRLILEWQGISAKVEACDIFFGDPDDGGGRVYGVCLMEEGAQVRNLDGNQGWDNIINAHPSIADDWILCERQSSASMVADDLRPEAGVDRQARELAGYLRAVVEERSLEHHTAPAISGRTGPRL